SIQSDFVRDEAEEAQQRNILVPVLKESVRPPAGFRQIQTADLSAWTGGAEYAEFRRVLLGIANLAGPPTNCEVGGPAVPASVGPPAASSTPLVATPLAAAPFVRTSRAANTPAVLSQ